MIRVLLAEPGRRSDREAVPGQDDGLADVHDPGDQVIEEPVKLAAPAHVLLLWCSWRRAEIAGSRIVARLAAVSAAVRVRHRLGRRRYCPGDVAAALPAPL